MKNLFIRFIYTELRNETHVEYNETFDSILINHNPQTLGVKPLYDAYKPLLDTEVAALDIIRKSGYTSEIDEQDSRRDSIFRGFTDAVKSALNHFNAAKKEAAHKIAIVLEHYGNIAAKTLDQETAAIDDLLRELNDNHSQDILLLALADWLSQLNIENETFKTLMMARYSETAQRPTTRMKQARTDVDKAFRAILNQIEALALVNGATAYTAFINELNAVSERYKNQLAQHAGRIKKGELKIEN
jgi:hypothetical protein